MLINESIITKHAEDAAFLWPQRDKAVRSNHYTERDLRRIDDRLAANLDGLLLAGERGFEICLAELRAHGDEGEVFSAGVLALATGATARLEPVFDAAFRSDAGARALVAAIAYHDFAHVEPLLRDWIGSRSAFARYLGIAGYAAHRRAPPADWNYLLEDASPRVARRAIRAVAELGCLESLAVLKERVEDAWFGFEVCGVLALRGAADESVLETLFAHLAEPNHTYRAALALSLAAPRALGAYARACLEARNEVGAIALIEAGGDLSWMPVLIRLMGEEACEHLAGEALHTMLGVDLEQSDLTRASERDSRDDNERSERYLVHEARLALPSALAVARWWRAHEPEFEPGMRYLAGVPVADACGGVEDAQREMLRQVVRCARPRQRLMAAQRLVADWPGVPSANTDAFLAPEHVVPGWHEAQPAPGQHARRVRTHHG